MKVGIPDPGFSHIMSFRRQLYVSPEGEKVLPESMQINYDDTNYWIYITNESMQRFLRNGMGHSAKYCPQNKLQNSTLSPNNTQVKIFLTTLQFNSKNQNSKHQLFLQSIRTQ